jgi:hypothetical protein
MKENSADQIFLKLPDRVVLDVIFYDFLKKGATNISDSRIYAL